MSGNVVAVLVVFLVLLFITMGAAIPMIVFWYNREDTRIYDGMRTRLIEEVGRLSLDVDELQQDLKIERDARQALEDLYNHETRTSRGFLDELETLKARISVLEQERGGLLARVAELSRATAAYRAGVVMMMSQLEKLNVRPSVMEVLRDMARRDADIAEFMAMVQEYLHGGK